MTQNVKEEIARVGTDKSDAEILEEFLDKGWKIAGSTVFVPPTGSGSSGALFCVLNKKQ